MTYQFLAERNVVQYHPMGITILFNRVYACISSMYTSYSNNYDTSHVAYPELITSEEQQAEWAIFAALQPPHPDSSQPDNRRHTSTPASLHTYTVKYIPPYIFPTSTSSHTLAPIPSPSTILPTDIASPPLHDYQKTQNDAANTHDLVQQMLNPLVNNSDATLAPAMLVPDLQADMPQVEEEENAKQPPPPEPPKERTEHVYTFQDL